MQSTPVRLCRTEWHHRGLCNHWRAPFLRGETSQTNFRFWKQFSLGFSRHFRHSTPVVSQILVVFPLRFSFDFCPSRNRILRELELDRAESSSLMARRTTDKRWSKVKSPLRKYQTKMDLELPDPEKFRPVSSQLIETAETVFYPEADFIMPVNPPN